MAVCVVFCGRGIGQVTSLCSLSKGDHEFQRIVIFSQQQLPKHAFVRVMSWRVAIPERKHSTEIGTQLLTIRAVTVRWLFGLFSASFRGYCSASKKLSCVLALPTKRTHHVLSARKSRPSVGQRLRIKNAPFKVHPLPHQQVVDREDNRFLKD